MSPLYVNTTISMIVTDLIYQTLDDDHTINYSNFDPVLDSSFQESIKKYEILIIYMIDATPYSLMTVCQQSVRELRHFVNLSNNTSSKE